MLALLKKDFRMYKSGILIAASFSVCFVIALFILKEAGYLVHLFYSFLLVNLFSNWSVGNYTHGNLQDILLNSLPVGKKKIVRGKYNFCLVLYFVFLLVEIMTFSAVRALNVFDINVPFVSLFMLLWIRLIIWLFNFSLVYAIDSYDAVFTKLLLQLSYLGLLILPGLLRVFFPNQLESAINFLAIFISKMSIGYLLIIIPVILLVFMYFSYKRSYREYCKLEF